MINIHRLKASVPLSVKRAFRGKKWSISRTNRGSSYEDFVRCIDSGEVRISLPGIDGFFWLDVRSHLLKRLIVTGSYESDVLTALSDNASNDFIDVGANVGFFSVHLATVGEPGATVLSLEPNPRAYKYLNRNLTENQLSDQVINLELAASDTNQVLSLNFIDGHEEYSSLKEMNHPGVKGLESQRVDVTARPLDSVVEEYGLNPGLVKIDAEGAEIEVLRGMNGILDKFSPTLVCEINADPSGKSIVEINKLFAKHGYKIFDLKGQKYSLDPSESCEIIARQG